MSKKVFLVMVALMLFVQFNAGAIYAQVNEGREPSVVAATKLFLEKGYKITSGHWFSTSRSLQKITEGKTITILMTADEKGESLKSLFIVPTAERLEETARAIESSITCLALAKRAKWSEKVRIERRGETQLVIIGKRRIALREIKTSSGTVFELF